MTILYCSPVWPGETISGGTRKLWDHVGILQENGFKAWVLHHSLLHDYEFEDGDLVVMPEIFGDDIRHRVLQGVKRVAFAQNGYLIDHGVSDPLNRHPYMTTPELIAVMTESDHTTELVKQRCPDLPVPIIRTHSSGNGRDGKPGPFSWGAWPREKRVVYFNYKYAGSNQSVFADLDLPAGWESRPLSGTDQEIAEALRTSAIFAACNRNEGMCAPTSEAMICGARIVCWPGGPIGQREIGGPMEYLAGRAEIAIQDDVEDLRRRIAEQARAIDLNPTCPAIPAKDSSRWFQATYSRGGEIAEICDIMGRLSKASMLSAV